MGEGEREGGLIERRGLLTFLLLKGGLIGEGGLNRGFMVHDCRDKRLFFTKNLIYNTYALNHKLYELDTPYFLDLRII